MCVENLLRYFSNSDFHFELSFQCYQGMQSIIDLFFLQLMASKGKQHLQKMGFEICTQREFERNFHATMDLDT